MTKRSLRFSLKVSRDELSLEFDAKEFWNEDVVRADGTTRLDENIETLCQEIRLALYYVATSGTNH